MKPSLILLLAALSLISCKEEYTQSTQPPDSEAIALKVNGKEYHLKGGREAAEKIAREIPIKITRLGSNLYGTQLQNVIQTSPGNYEWFTRNDPHSPALKSEWGKSLEVFDYYRHGEAWGICREYWREKGWKELPFSPRFVLGDRFPVGLLPTNNDLKVELRDLQPDDEIGLARGRKKFLQVATNTLLWLRRSEEKEIKLIYHLDLYEPIAFRPSKYGQNYYNKSFDPSHYEEKAK